MRVTGDSYLRLAGTADNGVRDGLYRGALEIRTAAGPGLNAINAVGLESYVLGVVPNESPSAWPAAALEAQAVAARTYALATGANGRGFDQYADTRSQVYRGRLSETLQASAAVAATQGEVVTYDGEVAVTYFFSTSGGYTENVENVFGGSAPKPWLQGVEDPYDDTSPYHRWGPYSFTKRGLAARLGGWVSGRLKSFKVLARGVSPRVVNARVRGTRGSVVVTGAQVRARLGLRDTWFFVRRVSSSADGGAEARTSSGERPLAAIHGSVDGYRADSVKLQRRDGDQWRTLLPVPVEKGHYRIHVGAAGDYRIVAGWAPGPVLHVEP
jgi:stage II sporulation protein D